MVTPYNSSKFRLSLGSRWGEVTCWLSWKHDCSTSQRTLHTERNSKDRRMSVSEMEWRWFQGWFRHFNDSTAESIVPFKYKKASPYNSLTVTLFQFCAMLPHPGNPAAWLSSELYKEGEKNLPLANAEPTISSLYTHSLDSHTRSSQTTFSH